MKIKLAQITTLLGLSILVSTGCGPSEPQFTTMTATARTSTLETAFKPSATSTSTLSPNPAFTSTPEATATPVYEVGNSWTRPKDGMLMMYVPAGSFTIGVDPEVAFAECVKNREFCDREWFTYTPVDTASTDAFWIDSTEVTNQMYAGCVSEGACESPRDTGLFDSESYGNFPVGYMSLVDAQSYCEWARARLPTHLEWEKAARGGLEGKLYPWGDDSPSCGEGRVNGAQGYYCKRGGIGKIVEVGSFGANGYGLFDMVGNTREWVSEGSLRGGSYDNFGKFLIVAYIYGENDESTIGSNGFRCVGWPQ